MYKKKTFIIRFQKKISPQVGLEPTKWDKKWVLGWLSFSERERKVKLALIDFKSSFRKNNSRGTPCTFLQLLIATKPITIPPALLSKNLDLWRYQRLFGVSCSFLCPPVLPSNDTSVHNDPLHLIPKLFFFQEARMWLTSLTRRAGLKHW